MRVILFDVLLEWHLTRHLVDRTTLHDLTHADLDVAFLGSTRGDVRRQRYDDPDGYTEGFSTAPRSGPSLLICPSR